MPELRDFSICMYLLVQYNTGGLWIWHGCRAYRDSHNRLEQTSPNPRISRPNLDEAMTYFINL